MAKKLPKDNIITFTFEGFAPYTIDCNNFAPEIRQQAEWHGFSQKLGDSYSSCKTERERHSAFLECLDSLEARNWNRGAGNAGGASDLSLAISRVKGIPIEKATAVVKGLNEEQLKTLGKNELIKAEVAKIRSERATARASQSNAQDLDSILGL